MTIISTKPNDLIKSPSSLNFKDRAHYLLHYSKLTHPIDQGKVQDRTLIYYNKINPRVERVRFSKAREDEWERFNYITEVYENKVDRYHDGSDK